MNFITCSMETMSSKKTHRNPEANNNNDFNKGYDACFFYKTPTEIWAS